MAMAPRAAKAASACSARPYLDAALAAERWIASSAIRDGDGLRWPVDPNKPAAVQFDLYSGSAGVVLFYLELHHATGEKRFLDEAASAARALIANLPEEHIQGDEGAGLYSGVAGTAYVLRSVYERIPTPAVERAIKVTRDLLRDAAKNQDGGVSWNAYDDIISGTSGIALALLWLGARDQQWFGMQSLVAGTVPSLVSHGIAEQGTLKWAPTPTMKRRYPNFSHGTAGVSYTLASIAMSDALRKDAPRRAAAKKAALQGAAYLERIATQTPGGQFKIFHSEPGNEQLFYMSWCHGPAGTARLYHQLARLTKEAKWNSYLPRLSQAMRDAGVPESHVDLSGFWNNISQCCGNCGVAEYFLARYGATRDAADLAFAQRVMDDVLARGTRDGNAMYWPQAENRMSPKDIIAQTGYMQGAAGVGVALLHTDGAINGRKPLIALPDTPTW
jgi:lantibiotic modifying enzyme